MLPPRSESLPGWTPESQPLNNRRKKTPDGPPQAPPGPEEVQNNHRIQCSLFYLIILDGIHETFYIFISNYFFRKCKAFFIMCFEEVGVEGGMTHWKAFSKYGLVRQADATNCL